MSFFSSRIRNYFFRFFEFFDEIWRNFFCLIRKLQRSFFDFSSVFVWLEPELRSEAPLCVEGQRGEEEELVLKVSGNHSLGFLVPNSYRWWSKTSRWEFRKLEVFLSVSCLKVRLYFFDLKSSLLSRLTVSDADQLSLSQAQKRSSAAAQGAGGGRERKKSVTNKKPRLEIDRWTTVSGCSCCCYSLPN